MKLMQNMVVVVKSGSSVTMSKATSAVLGEWLIAGSGISVDAHPAALSVDTVVLTTTAAFDTTFFGCPGVFRMILERIT